MISPLIAWGIGFGGVAYLPRQGFSRGAVPESSHNIYRLDQAASGGELFRGTAGGATSSDIYRTPPGSGGKVYR